MTESSIYVVRVMAALREEGHLDFMFPSESGSLQAVLRESLEEPLRRPLPNCIQDFGSSFLLKNCVTVHSADVVDSTDAKTLAEKGKFCLRVLTQLKAIMHCSNDVCLGQELVHDDLSGPTPQQLRV